MPELIRIVINEAMRLEQQPYLGVASYQRAPERHGHSNGFKLHSERTRRDEITFAVPHLKRLRLGIGFELVTQDDKPLAENSPALKALKEAARELGLKREESGK